MADFGRTHRVFGLSEPVANVAGLLGRVFSECFVILSSALAWMSIYSYCICNITSLAGRLTELA